MLNFHFRQQSAGIINRLLGSRCKQFLAGAMIAGSTVISAAPEAEAHWWNHCYGRPHYYVSPHYYPRVHHYARVHHVLPSCYGWNQFGFTNYSFPSYSHWYSFGHICYRPVYRYHVAYRPIVVRSILPRPIVHHTAWNSFATLQSDFAIPDNSTWNNDVERVIWDEGDLDWGTRSNVREESLNQPHTWDAELPANSLQHSVAKPKDKPAASKNITWEEALYGPTRHEQPIQFVSFQSPDTNPWSELLTDQTESAASLLPPGSPEIYPAPMVALSFSSESILVDTMVQAGNAAEAYESLQTYSTNPRGFDSTLQLRHAVLSLFASTDPIAIELVLDRFNSACAAGNYLDERSLGRKISDYLAPARIDVADTLNAFSKVALREQQPSVSQLLIVATLLRLDGERDRSQIFAKAAFDQAAETGSLQWNSLITKLLQ